MEGPQQQGPVSASFALHLGDRNPYDVADDVLVPLIATRAGSGSGPAEGQALSVAGAEVSAVVRDGGALHVRVFNPTDEPATVTIQDRHGWVTDLRGRPIGPFEGSFDLEPWAIATAAIAE
jgi:hypothetical protein